MTCQKKQNMNNIQAKGSQEVGLEEGGEGVPTSLAMERETTEALIRWYCGRQVYEI